MLDLLSDWCKSFLTALKVGVFKVWDEGERVKVFLDSDLEVDGLLELGVRTGFVISL